MLKSTVSQQVETIMTKFMLSQRVKNDAILYFSVGSVSFEISSVVLPDGDRVLDMDTEHIEKVCSVTAKGTKRNPRK